MIFYCPSCNSPIGELPPTGEKVLFCASCRFKYRAITGVLESNDSRQITHRRETRRQEGEYQREYEFRLARPNNRIEVVTARIEGRDERFRAKPNDRIAIVHAMRGHATENLVALINQTTGNAVVAGMPGQNSSGKATAIAGIAFLAVVYMLSLAGMSELWAAAFALVVAALAYFKLEDLFKPRHAISRAEQSTLARSTALLEQKTALWQQIAAVDRDWEEKAAMRDKLVRLKEMMDDVGAGLYQTRIERIQQALPLIEEQLQLDDKLRAAYGKALKMVEIELESQGAAGAIADDVAQALQERAEEIAMIESRTNDVKLLLAANEEVEQLLREG